jgi:hypothetical protein
VAQVLPAIFEKKTRQLMKAVINLDVNSHLTGSTFSSTRRAGNVIIASQ